jgi:hypothetical protein
MLLVILGAGASYDSAPSRPTNDGNYSNLPNRPPLAKELFGNRPYFGQVMQRYQDCLDIAPRLRHLQDGVSIESVLQLYQSEAIEDPVRVQQLAAVRYYLQEILTVCPSQWIAESHDMFNHRTLLDDIRHWRKPGERVCFVTFNYDLIIDSALSHAGLRLTDLSKYISSDFMLIKLHGSVNWGRVVATPLPEAILRDPRLMALELIRQAGSINISQDYVMAGGNPPSSRDNRGIFPALAIPVESKLEFECPEDHVHALRSFIPDVTKILIIGWRATEQPFLDMLQKGLHDKRCQVMVVNGSSEEGENAVNKIRELGFSCTYRVLLEGFTDFIRNNSGRAFLSS